MAAYSKPLKKSILISIIIFLLLLCFALCLSQYLRYRTMLYNRYEVYIENILRLAASEIDTDDLAECIRTGVESEKYHELQPRLDRFRDNADLHFLYVIVPLNTNETDNIMNVIAGVSAYEYEFQADEMVRLNQLTGDSYSPETAKKYLDAYESGELSFFEEKSQWGDDYTGLLPLYDSAGNRIAALCVDVDVLEIHTALRQNTINMILMILVLGVVFALVFIFWIDRNIIRPIHLLEKSVVKFVSTSHDQKDPNALMMEVPDIRTDNEVESLARAITQMSEDMRDYVKNIVFTEEKLAAMNVLANKDALTSVRNKNAYDQYARDLQLRLEQGPVSFAVLMVDLNYLKRINDTYGHEKGDLYIKNCCGMICEIFRHSPVFRVGGDEFIVVLTERDYNGREHLLKNAREEFRKSAADETAEPWERISVAIGMAEYEPGSGETVETVLDRADKNMYEEKARMKIQR